MEFKKYRHFQEILIDAVLIGLVLWGVLFMFSIIGCVSTPLVQGPQAGVIFKYDIKGTINGAAFNGVGVVPYAPNYDMKIISTVDVDLLSVTSCHRDFTVESAIEVGWFQPKRGYSYNYAPARGLEDVGSCLVRFGAYNKAKGQNAWGIVDFETPDTDLPAENVCDDQDETTNGVSICQSRAGLLQKIIFETPVRQSVKFLNPKCVIKPPADGKNWTYETPLGECVIAFGETVPPYRIHRHTTIGFTDVQIRGGQ